MPDSQSWNPERYVRNAGFVAELGRPVLSLLDPQPGERILDLGCGDGRLTREIADMGCDVVGVDASAEQIAAAADLGLDARVVDARELEFATEFDAVFSNAALHWIKPPEDVVAGVLRALKPGGRFVGEFGGAGNVSAIVGALNAELETRGIDAVDPWYFPEVAEYRDVLQRVGFGVSSIELIPRPTELPTDVVGWLETFGDAFTSAIPTGERDDFHTAVRERLRPILFRDARWVADYVRLRFRAEKPV